VPVGQIDPARDLIADFVGAGFSYAATGAELKTISAKEDKILGLFHTSNMDVAMDKIAGRRGGAAVATIATFPDQPMLDEMTDKALGALSKNREGFVLMVEGASIDKQAHNMDTERWVLDAVEFDRVVARCIAFQEKNPDTLIVVTADHECAGINIIGGSLVTNANLLDRSDDGGADAQPGVINGATGTATDGQKRLRTDVTGVYEAAGFPQYDITPDGYPTTMDVDYKMLIGYAGNADRYEDWLTNPVPATPTNRDTAGDFFITGQVSGTSAVHTASDIPLSAGGRGSSLFTGVMDNTEVFFRVLQVAIGGAK